MRLSKSDRKALQLLQEVKALKEASDREIMSWLIQRVVPRASVNLLAFLDGIGPAVIVEEHKRPAKKKAPPAKRRRRR
jgi:hypothetical protein